MSAPKTFDGTRLVMVRPFHPVVEVPIEPPPLSVWDFAMDPFVAVNTRIESVRLPLDEHYVAWTGSRYVEWRSSRLIKGHIAVTELKTVPRADWPWARRVLGVGPGAPVSNPPYGRGTR